MPLTLYPGQTVMGSGNVFVYGEAAPNIEIVPGPGQSISIPPPSSFSVNADGWNYAVTGYSPTDGAPYDWSLTVSPSAAPGDYIADFWAQESLLLPEYGDRLPFTVVAGSSSSGTGTASSSSASSNSGGNGSSGSSGGGCLQPGTTGTLSIGYDSIDPIYSESAGYWVVFDDTVKVVADIDTPYGWTMDFDDPSNPSVAFVGVDPEAVSCNYFINYYIPLPSSSSSSSGGFSSSSSSSSGSSGSSSSSGSNGSYEDVALFVASFCVGAMSSSSSSLAAVSSSGSSSGSSDVANECDPYIDAWFNPEHDKDIKFDKNYFYRINGVTFHGTNDQVKDLTTNLTINGIAGNYHFSMTPPQPLGVCIPSDGPANQNDPNASWTNFKTVLQTAFPDWVFQYVGQTNPLPSHSLKGHTYEVQLGRSIGYLNGKIARFGVRLHLEYCTQNRTPKYHWIQVYWLNYNPIQANDGTYTYQIENAVDGGNPYFRDGTAAVGLIPASQCEAKHTEASGVFISDDPQMTEVPSYPNSAYTIRLETFLVEDVTQSNGPKTVNVYDGIRWGWTANKAT